MAVEKNSSRSLAFFSNATSLPAHVLCSSTRRGARLVLLAIVPLAVALPSLVSCRLQHRFSKLVVSSYNNFISSVLVSFSGNESSTTKRQPTKRAADGWESARFTSIFLASSFFCSQTESTPAPAPVTQTVSPPLAISAKSSSNIYVNP